MNRGKIERLIDKLTKGAKFQDIKVFSSKPKQGRFAEEFNVDVFAQRGEDLQLLLHIKVFLGRGHYRDWIEIFGISKEVFGENYFGSEIEAFILDEFSTLTGRIFVEYFEDVETVKELSAGVPSALSRLGFELAKKGFSWFKDWYFPEGLMEGGHKLQAEKPFGREAKEKHLRNLKEEFEKFLRSCEDLNLKVKVEERFKILENLWNRD